MLPLGPGAPGATIGPSPSSRTCRARRSGLAPSPTGRVSSSPGAEFTITTEPDVRGDQQRSQTTYPGPARRDVTPGDRPPRRRLGRAPGAGGRRADGSSARSSRAAASPTTRASTCPASVSAPALTGEGRDDLRLRACAGVDLIALSFVRARPTSRPCARIMDEEGACLRCAKIEKPEAVDDLDAIIDAADGIMVARGDLGVELPPEDGAARAEAPCSRPERGQAGHHRHADARVDDREPAADPRRGLRRRQRRPRRHRRGHALRRDRVGVPAAGRPH